MDELKITKRTEPVMFTIRVDKSIVDFYDDLAQKTNRSRNELIGLALEYAKDKIKIEPYSALTKFTPHKKDRKRLLYRLRFCA